MKPPIEKLTPDYIAKFASCEIPSNRLGEVDQIITQLVMHRDRYETVSDATRIAQSSSPTFDLRPSTFGPPAGVPWFIIALLHELECSQRFDQHLHNGDSLARPTVNDPAHRPPGWMDLPKAMRTWERSAEDSLAHDGLDQFTHWDIPRICYEFETFNGFGYSNRGVANPYLWGGSNHYKKGKYIRDHVYDENAVSSQIGTATLLHRLTTRGLVPLRAIAANA